MICIEESIGDNWPRHVPGEVFIINQYTHQFRDSQGGMRLEEQFCNDNNESEKKETYIVQLNCHIWGEIRTDLEWEERHTQSGNSWMGLPRFLKRRMISPRLAAVQKLNKISGAVHSRCKGIANYCCFNRSSLPTILVASTQGNA